MGRKPHKDRFPTKQQLLDYIREQGGKINKRDIANAFHIRGDDRKRLRDALKDLQSDGSISGRGRQRRLNDGSLPPVIIVEVIGLNEQGEAIAHPAKWEDTRKVPPHITLTQSDKAPAPAIGQRALVKLRSSGKHQYEGTVLRLISDRPVETVLGVYQSTKRGGMIEPVSRKQKQSYYVPQGSEKDATSGDLVIAQVQPRSRDKQLGVQEATVTECFGDSDSPLTFSLIAIHHNDIPTIFPEEAIAEAEASEDPVPDGRTDLRDIPLITIDGADARDFDDAVWAEPTKDGWHLMVAIADVAHYVKMDSALDREALKRGNSTYFPDRVVPMLPEALSNGLCSLNPNVDRYCLAVHLWITDKGELIRYEFVRGIMRSHARLTYEQAQGSFDTQNPVYNDILSPLYGAYQSLQQYRAKRGALELDLPEFNIVIGDDGHVAEVNKRQRLDSHKLIEEFMICANVAAANAIEKHGLAGVFRIHESPAADKVEELRRLLQTMEYSLPTNPSGHHFNRLLKSAADTPEAHLITGTVLRSQMQAYYTPKNLGHFGLGLEQYCHFTSPIRRYADLIVHRALIQMLGLTEPDEAASTPDREKLGGIADHISTTERNSMLAEREATDRYITAYMADHVEAEFEGHISSVGSYGIFVTLKETGASGLIRISELGNDFYILDEPTHRLIGRETGQYFQLGQRLVVKVAEADTQLGSLRFQLITAEPLPPIAKPDRLPRGKPRKERNTQKPRGKNKNKGKKGKKRK